MIIRGNTEADRIAGGKREIDQQIDIPVSKSMIDNRILFTDEKGNAMLTSFTKALQESRIEKLKLRDPIIKNWFIINPTYQTEDTLTSYWQALWNRLKIKEVKLPPVITDLNKAIQTIFKETQVLLRQQRDASDEEKEKINHQIKIKKKGIEIAIKQLLTRIERFLKGRRMEPPLCYVPPI